VPLMKNYLESGNTISNTLRKYNCANPFLRKRKKILIK